MVDNKKVLCIVRRIKKKYNLAIWIRRVLFVEHILKERSRYIRCL